MAVNQRWNRSGFSRPDPTGKFQNHRRLTGRSTGFWPARSTGFLQKVFVHCSLFNVSNKKFSKGEGGMAVSDFGRGSQKKNAKLFLSEKKNFFFSERKSLAFFFSEKKNVSEKKLFRFSQKWLNFKTFFGYFRSECPVLSGAKRAQNKHKKHWRAQAKLLDVLSNDILRKAKK